MKIKYALFAASLALMLYLTFAFEVIGPTFKYVNGDRVVQEATFNTKSGLTFYKVNASGMINEEFYLKKECSTHPDEESSTSSALDFLDHVMTSENMTFEFIDFNTLNMTVKMQISKDKQAPMVLEAYREACEITDPSLITEAKKVYELLN